jgi:predicted acylesterase/phospholipase RssA
MRPEILCLSGGGLKTIISLGALSYLESIDMLSNIKIYIGCSTGAFISYLLCIGYKAKEIYNIIEDKKINLNYLELLNNIYICKIDILIEIIKKCTIEKFGKIITLKELYELTGKKFMCTTFSLEYYKILLLSDFNDPNLSIVDAIKLSSNLPILFKPIKYDSSYCIDASIISNFPINDFETKKFILGININTENNNINNIVDYFSIIFESISKYINKKNDINNNKFIINLQCNNIDMINIEFYKRKELYKIGKLQCYNQIKFHNNLNINNIKFEKELDDTLNSPEINFLIYCIEKDPILVSKCIRKYKKLFALSLLSDIASKKIN